MVTASAVMTIAAADMLCAEANQFALPETVEVFFNCICGGLKDFRSHIPELIKTLTEDFDVKFYICASCVKHQGLEGAELVEGAEIRPGSFLGQMLMELEREALTF